MTARSIDEERTLSDKDEIVEAIEELKRQVKESDSPEMLNFYRRQFRRLVPLSLRGYVSAYLLKEHLGGGAVRATVNQMKALFVSVGKNHKVFPNDLTKLFAEGVGVGEAAVGSVKVLDNYSFVEMPERYAEKAIERLNETTFRGKTLTVDHARKKR